VRATTITLNRVTRTLLDEYLKYQCWRTPEELARFLQPNALSIPEIKRQLREGLAKGYVDTIDYSEGTDRPALFVMAPSRYLLVLRIQGTVK
jgi:hypothetical protein